jgi:predicted permease
MALLSELGSVYLNALFPLFLYCGVGVIAFRFLDLDRTTLSKVSVYVLLPPLFFSNLMQVKVPTEDIFKVALFCCLILGSMAVIGRLYSKLVAFDSPTTSSAVLSVTFFNAVNLGFPVALFAFGEEGLLYAGLLVAVNAVPHNGFSMYVAARGQMSRRNAAFALARMPIFYVLILATLFRLTGITVTETIMAPITTMGEAAIPVILICVGMELASIQIKTLNLKLLGVVIIRLCLAPMVAAGITSLIGVDGLLRSVLILLSSMPSAMAPIVYARVFGGNVESLTQAVFYSTIGCFFSLPILLILLR